MLLLHNVPNLSLNWQHPAKAVQAFPCHQQISVVLSTTRRDVAANSKPASVLQMVELCLSVISRSQGGHTDPFNDRPEKFLSVVFIIHVDISIVSSVMIHGWIQCDYRACRNSG